MGETLTHDRLTTEALLASLASQLCPACGGRKQRKHTLCSADYFALPRGLRAALYARVNAGYQEAVIDAMRFLERPEFRLPEES